MTTSIVQFDSGPTTTVGWSADTGRKLSWYSPAGQPSGSAPGGMACSLSSRRASRAIFCREVMVRHAARGIVALMVTERMPPGLRYSSAERAGNTTT